MEQHNIILSVAILIFSTIFMVSAFQLFHQDSTFEFVIYDIDDVFISSQCYNVATNLTYCEHVNYLNYTKNNTNKYVYFVGTLIMTIISAFIAIMALCILISLCICDNDNFNANYNNSISNDIELL